MTVWQDPGMEAPEIARRLAALVATLDEARRAALTLAGRTDGRWPATLRLSAYSDLVACVSAVGGTTERIGALLAEQACSRPTVERDGVEAQAG